MTRPDATFNVSEVLSDEYGNFTTSYVLDGVTGTYNVTATDGTNTATTTFTDSYNIASVSVGAQSPSIVHLGDSATFGISSTWTGGTGGPVNTARALSLRAVYHQAHLGP